MTDRQTDRVTNRQTDTLTEHHIYYCWSTIQIYVLLAYLLAYMWSVKSAVSDDRPESLTVGPSLRVRSPTDNDGVGLALALLLLLLLAARLHIQPASSLCRQSLTPQFLWKHSTNDCSSPVHVTSSSQIGCEAVALVNRCSVLLMQPLLAVALCTTHLPPLSDTDTDT